MKRDLDALANRRFDILVVGGGIYGACIARDAAMRGLSVALIEKSDFCSGTSHNSLKIIHNGIRYLQHLDFQRVRESILERRIWLSIAPHLVQPLKVIIPAQGWTTRGPVALAAAQMMHRLIGFDWNAGLPPEQRIPTGRVFGRKSLRALIPGLPLDGLSGAASWHDGQVSDADRIVIECLQSAVADRAEVANYVEADTLLRSNGKVHGVCATDRVEGREFEIRAKVTVNAAGPWTKKLLHRSLGSEVSEQIQPLARNFNIVTNQLLHGYAVGVPSKRSSDAVLGSESRLFFITPWQDVSVIGTTHFPYDGDPDDYAVTEDEIDEFLAEINESYPSADLTKEKVLYVYGGLTPAEPETVRGEVGRSKRAEVIDHGLTGGPDGLVSVVGVKYTTGRLVAERVVSLVQKKLGLKPSPGRARQVQLPGAARAKSLASAETDTSTAFSASVERAVDDEMAMNLQDFLLRRTDIVARGRLTQSLVSAAADIMSRRHGWTQSESRIQQEKVLAAVRYLGDKVPEISGLPGETETARTRRR